MLEKILEGCDKLFRKFGIKSLTMDDISRELGISKKTLYQYVTDKNDLVKQTFASILNSQNNRCLEIANSTKNPIEEILLITREVSHQMKGTNPSIFFDLQKYHPDAWRLFTEFSKDVVYNQLKTNLELGKSQGYYRPEIDTDILAKLYISMMQTLTNVDVFPQMDYNFTLLYNELIKYHINGICTPKGLKIINKHFNL